MDLRLPETSACGAIKMQRQQGQTIDPLFGHPAGRKGSFFGQTPRHARAARGLQRDRFDFAE
jgi:hypothetical protein